MSLTERPVTELLSLKGKVAIVTGACGWLGSAMSRALAEAGATLVVTSRDGERAARFAAELPGEGHAGMAFDQDRTGEIPSFMAEVVRRAGQVDILVNNAYSSRAPDIDDATDEDFMVSYHLGVVAPFLLAREVMFHLRDRGAPGSIINIASMYGVVASYPDVYERVPRNSPPNYHALKGGLIHLTRHLAAYWAPHGIRVNAISPGPFPGPASQEHYPDFVSRLETRVPLGRIGRPEELKGAVLLLASDAGSYITGQNLLVDGGWTVW